jgi:hypothetical protein
MDLTQIIAVGVTALLSIGGIGVFVAKNIAKAKKAINVASESLDLVNTVIKSLEIKAGETKSELTADEIKAITAEYNELMAAIKAK